MALPAIRTGNPLSTFRSMLDEFFNEPFFLSDRDLTGKMWPRVDINEDKERFVVRADLPGMKKEDINVSIEGDTLTISGEKKEEFKKEEGAYSHFERSYGTFNRAFTLPENVDKDKVDAKYKDGVLELSLIKTGEPKIKGKKIEIKS
ncbi:MAG: Hsp20/alpha crystallin family protein [Chitinispirillaceae bacterium]